MNNFELGLCAAQPIKITFDSGFEINYMDTATMDGFFGYAVSGKVFVRSNLPDPIQQFVIEHEKYHLRDRRSWLGWLGAELRANTYCGLRDPIGLIKTLLASLSKLRLKTYVVLVMTNGKTHDNRSNEA
jgi:hypothetical protein